MPRAVRTNHADAQDLVLKAMADPTRRAIVRLLGLGAMRVSDVAARFPQSRPAISKHLAVLRNAGLVHVVQRGRERWHALEPQAWKEAAGYVNDIEAFWAERMEQLDERLRRDGP